MTMTQLTEDRLLQLEAFYTNNMGSPTGLIFLELTAEIRRLQAAQQADLHGILRSLKADVRAGTPLTPEIVQQAARERMQDLEIMKGERSALQDSLEALESRSGPRVGGDPPPPWPGMGVKLRMGDFFFMATTVGETVPPFEPSQYSAQESGYWVSGGVYGKKPYKDVLEIYDGRQLIWKAS